MAKRVLDSQVVRGLADETQRASEDIRAALARCARDVDQAPWLPWERGSGWGKVQWNGVYGTIDRETAGWFNMGGLQEDAGWLRARADVIDWEAKVMSVIDGMIAVPAWMLAEVESIVHGAAPSTSKTADPSRQGGEVAMPKSTQPKENAPAISAHESNVSKALQYLGAKGIPAYAGRSDIYDGECVSLVKRYIQDLDPDAKSLRISPSNPGAAYSTNWEKFTPGQTGFAVKVGDVLYLNYGHVAIATTDQDPVTGKFAIIESHGWVKGSVPPGVQVDSVSNGGYVPKAKDSVVQLSSQTISRVTAIMRPKA